MSALVLGKRSTSCFFEELHHHPAATPAPSPSATKRARLGATPPLFSPPLPSISTSSTGTCLSAPVSDSADGVYSSSQARDNQTLLFHLRSLFPVIDQQLLQRALEASGNDLDSAVSCLKELHFGSTVGHLQSAGGSHLKGTGAGLPGNTSEIGASENPSALNFYPADGSEWVELLVREMMGATDVDDARVRASRLLEFLEKSIMTQASAEVAQTFHKENVILKEQVEELLHDNNILKRAVAIQHERQKEFDEKNQELLHLKQLVAQYQEQLRAIEINNYALSMHLRQAQQGSSIPGRFHPDFF